MTRVARSADVAMAVDREENDEKILPHGNKRRSERVKGRKSAPASGINIEDGDDVEEDDRDGDPTEDEDDDEVRADKRRKRARKTSSATAGRRRGSGAKMNGVAKGTKGKGGRKPRKSDAVNVDLKENTNECPMLEAVLDDKVALDATILEWIERDEEDEPAAMTEMCCGCNFEIRQEDVDNEDNITDNLAEIQEAYKQTNPREYPLIATKKPQYRKFPKRLQEFFRRLVTQLSAKGFLSNPDTPTALDKIQQWVFSLSSTNFRPFRHTATAISLGLISTLAEIYAKVNKALDSSNVLLEKEKRGKRGKGAGTRVKDVERIAKEQEAQLEVLKGLMESTYDGVFVHRFRDVDHRIRTECVHELGVWMQKLPQVYFDGSHLRYMGWALSDANATTRLDVVKSLQKLYENDEYISNLRHFTERFQSRFMEMATADADRSVRVATIILLENIRQRDLLDPEDIDNISLMIFDPEGRIRKAVASTFLAGVDALYEETCEEIGGSVEAVEEELGDDRESGDGVPFTWLKLNALVKTLVKYDALVDETEKENGEDESRRAPFRGFELGQVEGRIAMAASSIIAEMDELQNWDNLARYLLRDHSIRPHERSKSGSILAKARKACALTASEEIILLEVLNASVKARRDYEDEHEDSKGKKRKRGDEQAEPEPEMDVSTGLVRKLPQLIHRFGSKPETAAQILRLVQYVKLDKYDELRQLEAFEKLLEDVGKQFMNHTDSNVFKEASASLLHAQKFERLGYLTEPKVIELQDEVNSSFLSIVDSKDLVAGQLTSDEIGDLTIAVARLENLLSVADCTMALSDENTKQGTSSFTLFVSLIERSVIVHDPGEVEMISHVMKALRWYFMWRIRAVATLESDNRIDQDALEDLRNKRTSAIDELSQVITQRPADELRIQAATLLLDLYTLFTTLPKSSRDEVLAGDSQPPQLVQDNLTDVLEEEINLLHLAEKKSSKIVRGDDGQQDREDEEDENENEEMGDIGDLPPEARGAIHEKRVIELGAKIVLAVLSGALPQSFAQTLLHHKGKTGQSFDKLLLELGVESKPAEKATTPGPAAEVVPVTVAEQVEVERGSQIEDS